MGCNVSFCGECFSLKCWRERERLSSRRGWNPHQVFGTGKGGVIFEEEVLGLRNRIMLSGSSRPSTFIDDILVSGAQCSDAALCMEEARLASSGGVGGRSA